MSVVPCVGVYLLRTECTQWCADQIRTMIFGLTLSNHIHWTWQVFVFCICWVGGRVGRKVGEPIALPFFFSFLFLSHTSNLAANTNEEIVCALMHFFCCCLFCVTIARVERVFPLTRIGSMSTLWSHSDSHVPCRQVNSVNKPQKTLAC